jgi:hypothetical protein
MAQKISLKEIEKKIYKSLFMDGLFEIVLGMSLFGNGLMAFLDDFIHPMNYIIGLSFSLLGFFIFLLVKKYVIIPRLGQVKISFKKSSSAKRLALILIISIIFTIIWFIISLTNIFPANYLIVVISIAIIVIIPMGFIAYFAKSPQIYLYAVSIVLTFPFVEVLYYFGFPYSGLIVYSILGCIIISIGLIFFIRFLKKYPLQVEPDFK